jgi:hypothetical protein
VTSPASSSAVIDPVPAARYTSGVLTSIISEQAVVPQTRLFNWSGRFRDASRAVKVLL